MILVVSISSVAHVRPNRRLEQTHRAKLKRAAECLTSHAPAWLIRVLSNFSFDVKTQHHVDDASPTRKERFETNLTGNESTRDVLKFLQNSFATELLVAHSPESEALRHQVEPLLQGLLMATHKVHKALTEEHGDNVQAGRGRARLPGCLPAARYVCAAIIVEAADFLTRNGFDTPPKTALYDAATALWTSLLPLNGWGDGRRNGWRIYFKAAGDDSLIDLRREVRRWLEIEMSLFSRRK